MGPHGGGAEVLLHSTLPTRLEMLGPAAHRIVSSLSLQGKKQSLDGQGTVLWAEPLPGGEVRPQ